MKNLPTLCNESSFVAQFNNHSFKDKGNFAVYSMQECQACDPLNIKRQSRQNFS